MLYGSGEYDGQRNFSSSPVPRVRPEATGIADKHRGVGMYSCLNQPQISSFGRTNQTANTEIRQVKKKSPILVDPIYNDGKYSNRSARPVPRVRPEAEEVAEKSKGCMGMLFSNYGKPDPYAYANSRDENINPKDGPLRQAGVRSPILVDPVYQPGNYSGRTPRPAPRVRPEAEEIANRSKGVVGNLFVTPERRYNEIPKQKKPETNHTAENVKRMRKIQRESKAREREKNTRNTPVKALWKSTQYDSVQSRVKDYMQDPPKAPRDQPERPHSAPARSNRVTEENKNETVFQPKKSMTPRQPKNFIARNAKVARSYELGRSKSQMAVEDANSRYQEGLKKYQMNIRGKTPSYLQSRQKQWDRDERTRIRNMPDPTVPEGHTVLPDQERRETLNTLQTSQNELLEQHRLLPVRSADSLGVRNRKNDLERRIMEVDEAIKVFSRNRVFVKVDE